MSARDEHGQRGSHAARRLRLTLPPVHTLLTIVLGITLVVMLIAHWDALVGGSLVAIGLVAACLLVHPLMHRAHGGHRGASGHTNVEASEDHHAS